MVQGKKPPKDVLFKKYITEDKTRTELAEKYGVSVRTIKRWLHEEGIKKPNIKIPPKEELETKYIKEKATMDSIALAYSVSRMTIKKWLKHYKIPLREKVHNKIRPEKKELSEWYLDKKLTLEEIAVKYGVKKRTVQSWVDKYFSKDEKDLRRGFIASGYKKVHLPEHPCCDNKGYVIEHRLIMEKAIGRNLTNREQVHHLDLNKLNNLINNLVLFPSGKEHQKFHRYVEHIGNYLLGISKIRPNPIIFNKEVFFQSKWTKEINLLAFPNINWQYVNNI